MTGAIFFALALTWAILAHCAFLIMRKEAKRAHERRIEAERMAAYHREIGDYHRDYCRQLARENNELIEAAYRAAHRERQLVDALRARAVVASPPLVGWSATWEN